MGCRGRRFADGVMGPRGGSFMVDVTGTFVPGSSPGSADVSDTLGDGEGACGDRLSVVVGILGDWKGDEGA